MIRAFFGIPCTPDMALPLKKACRLLHSKLDTHVRWIEPHHWHITLKFMAAVDPQTLAALSEGLAVLSAEMTSFQLTVKEIRVFPHPGSSIIAASILPHATLSQLHQNLDHIGETHGVRAETRRYRPHITVAQSQTIPLHIHSFIFTDFQLWVKEIVLYKSEPQASGSQYISLRRFKLLE